MQGARMMTESFRVHCAVAALFHNLCSEGMRVKRIDDEVFQLHITEVRQAPDGCVFQETSPLATNLPDVQLSDVVEYAHDTFRWFRAVLEDSSKSLEPDGGLDGKRLKVQHVDLRSSAFLQEIQA